MACRQTAAVTLLLARALCTVPGGKWQGISKGQKGPWLCPFLFGLKDTWLCSQVGHSREESVRTCSHLQWRLRHRLLPPGQRGGSGWITSQRRAPVAPTAFTLKLSDVALVWPNVVVSESGLGDIHLPCRAQGTCAVTHESLPRDRCLFLF